MERTTHIAILPSPGYSHLVPILEFSKRLVHLHPDFHVTCIIPSLGSPPTASKSILESLPPNIDSIFLPPINKKDLPQGIPPQLQIQLTVNLSLPHVYEELKSLSSRTKLAALVTDYFGYEAQDFAKEFNILTYVHFPFSAMTLSLCCYSSELDKKYSCEYRDLTEPIQIPGCVPLHGCDLFETLQDRSSEAYRYFLERSKRFRLFDGILVNSFVELEEATIKALQEESGNPCIYTVGPITRTSSSIEPKCLRWLENQPSNSVVYVSFGSGGTLSQDQLNELALGLELSGQKFLWVLRAPSNSTNAAYLDDQNEDPLQFLPSGFLERTKEQGLVVPSWAPQIEILKHKSTGGFLSHCGWNSTLESVQQGVPLIAWPLFAEQRMNAVLLTDALKVALWPKTNERDIVVREEIARLMKILMEGEEGKEIHRRMKDMKDAPANALKDDGSSTKTLSQLALQWKSSSECI